MKPAVAIVSVVPSYFAIVDIELGTILTIVYKHLSSGLYTIAPSGTYADKAAVPVKEVSNEASALNV